MDLPLMAAEAVQIVCPTEYLADQVACPESANREGETIFAGRKRYRQRKLQQMYAGHTRPPARQHPYACPTALTPSP
jgi:hypothetical protein